MLLGCFVNVIVMYVVPRVCGERVLPKTTEVLTTVVVMVLSVRVVLGGGLTSRGLYWW